MAQRGIYIEHFDGTERFWVDSAVAFDSEWLKAAAERVLGIPARHLRLERADGRPLGDPARFENYLPSGSVVKAEVVVDPGLERPELEAELGEALVEISRLRARVAALEASPSTAPSDLTRAYVPTPYNGSMDKCFCVPERAFQATFAPFSGCNTPRGTVVRFRDDFEGDPRAFLELYEYDGDRSAYRRNTGFHCLGTHELDVSELERRPRRKKRTW